MKSVPTFTADIYCGSRVEYSEEMLSAGVLEEAATEYCNRVGLCVTITELEFIYTGGREYGFKIGLINYPRFESMPADIKKQALELAEILRIIMQQKRVSIVFPDETIMLTD